MAANLPVLAAIKMSKILSVPMCVRVFVSARYVSVCSHACVFACVFMSVCVRVCKCGDFKLISV